MIVVITMIIAMLFCNGSALGIEIKAYAAGYENLLFDQSKVHTMDIVMNDWEDFIESCASEQYKSCSVVIDGEAYKNVGIRGKGNTSLSTVSSMGSSRYSFKIEFDQYDNAKNYHGLDKLCLNNIIQDNTYMKDYLSYTLMSSFGVDAPLCSYVYITVNGEDWGLYLAVEGVEDSFLNRNYGTDHGELYKPDSMSFGGGRGNGKDFSMSDFMEDRSDADNSDSQTKDLFPQTGNEQQGMPDFGGFNGFGGNMPDSGDIPADFGGEMPDLNNGEARNFGGGNMFGFGGMGSSDVKLQYIDDDPNSYSNIFNNAKTNISDADKSQLISSLKALSEGTDIESIVNTDEVIRYFAVHNFLCNGDSYTGSMIHNYYLYEKDGQLSMIPWDYNLAFGTFQGSDATSQVNSPIDTPVSGGISDRPMIAWIFGNEEYVNTYHELLKEFISQTDFEDLINNTSQMISEYVQKDPTKFCTFEEFEKGVEAIRAFCELRAQSISGQLDGSIPSTSDGQNADKSALVDASALDISAMGTMGGGGRGGFDRGSFSKGDSGEKTNGNGNISESVVSTSLQQLNDSQPGGFNGSSPEGFNGELPSGINGEIPEGFEGELPNGFSGELPEGFDGSFPENPVNGSSNNSSAGNGDSSNGSESNSGRPQSGFGDNNGNFNGNAAGGNKMPQSMGEFPGMNGSSGSGVNRNVILLIVSTGVLAVGLIVAFLFKR